MLGCYPVFISYCTRKKEFKRFSVYLLLNASKFIRLFYCRHLAALAVQHYIPRDFVPFEKLMQHMPRINPVRKAGWTS